MASFGQEMSFGDVGKADVEQNDVWISHARLGAGVTLNVWTPLINDLSQ